MTPSVGIEPHWWEASALTTAPAQFPDPALPLMTIARWEIVGGMSDALKVFENRGRISESYLRTFKITIVYKFQIVIEDRAILCL